MTVPIGQILGSDNLIGAIKRIASGLPNPLPTGLFTTTEAVTKDYAKIRTWAGSRANANVVSYGSPAVRADKIGLDERAIKLIHEFEYQAFPMDTLINLNSMSSETLQNKGVEEVGRQTAEFAQRFQNSRISMVASALSKGKIYVEAEGTIATVSDNAVITVDFKIPAGQKSQVGGIIGTSWANVAVDIQGDVAALKRKMFEVSGKMPKFAFYGANIAGYLLGNTVLKNLLNILPTQANAMFRGETIPDGTLGLTWIDCSNMFMLSGTTVVNWFGADDIALTPDIDSSWWRMLEGSTLVPTDIGRVGATVEEMVSSLREVNGMFSYAVQTNNPAGATQYFGDTVLPTIVNPGSLIIVDVVP